MENKLRVWWIPQVPMKSFYFDVASVEEGAKVMDVLERYDAFQFENNVKPDYCNEGGLEMFDPEDDTDSPEGSWTDWYSEEAYTEDIAEYLEWKAERDAA